MKKINQTINEKLCDGTILIGYGKRGHGMNGKDADLDRVGQCKLTELKTVEDGDNFKIEIELSLYVCICSPSFDGIEFRNLRDTCGKETKEFFLKHYKIDLNKVDEESDEETLDKIVDFWQEQATEIVMGMNATPGDPFAIMWGGDSWDGGITVTLEVPLSAQEYEEIESGNEETLGVIANRINTEIYAGNEGGTPERDRMKQWEEEVGLCNDLINKLECYNSAE
jgi:hypothetical protein